MRFAREQHAARRWSVALAAAVAVALVAFSTASGGPIAAVAAPMPVPTMSMPMTTMSMPTTTMGGGTDGLPPGDWTPAQRTYLLNLIAETEADLPMFSDPTYLTSIGFENFGASAPGGYVHYINPAWIDDSHILDPMHPESVLFQDVFDPDTSTFHLEARAAMYFLPTGTTMENIPANFAWVPGWHVHPDVCVNDDMTFAGLASANGSCSSGHPMTGPPMTHVWVVDNGCGHRFAMVDVAGLMCELDMHMPMPSDPDGPSTTMGGPMPGMPTRSMPGGVRDAQAATPVASQPTYTG